MSIDVQASPVPRSDFYDDVVSGLQQTPKTIPSKYLYDDRGSQLFHQICALPEYYLTRTELSLTEEYAADFAAQVGSRARLVELGVGRGLKSEILLRHLHELAAYVPVDISPAELRRCVDDLGEKFPSIDITPVCADYTDDFGLPKNGFEGRSVFYYPGSTIGNFAPEAARGFLHHISELAGPRGAMLIGVDLHKDDATLHAAYNDSEGVTAEFNLNLLRRINRECGANFDLDAFRHRAVYQPDHHRIEMRLISTRPQTVQLPDRVVSFDDGEVLVTEHSYKFTIEDFATLCEESGWRVRSLWTDDQNLFSLWYLENGAVH